VTDRFGQTLPSATFTVNMLIGDVNGDRVVNASDTVVTRNRSGSASDGTNFRSDINLDSVINTGDNVIIRNASGNGLP
jgi:hypothetical protein